MKHFFFLKFERILKINPKHYYGVVKNQAAQISNQTGCVVSSGNRDSTDGNIRLFGTDSQIEAAKQLIESLPAVNTIP